MKVILLRLLRKIRILRYLDLKLNLRLSGHVFKVPIIKETGFNNHCMDEYWMLDLFRQFKFGPSDILLDAGANVGQTLLKWKAVNPAGPYIGVEPLPECVQYIRELIRRNNFKDCHLFQNALAEESGAGTLNLHYRDPTDRTASLLDSQKNIITSIQIDKIGFNALIERSNMHPENIKCIKIDTEGSELEILKAMMHFLKLHRPILIVEILEGTDANSTGLMEINQIVEAIGYRIFRVVKKDMKLESLLELKKLVSPYSVDESDYVLMP